LCTAYHVQSASLAAGTALARDMLPMIRAGAVTAASNSDGGRAHPVTEAPTLYFGGSAPGRLDA